MMLKYTIYGTNAAGGVIQTAVVDGTDVKVADGVLTVVAPIQGGNPTHRQVVFAAPVQNISHVESAAVEDE